MQQWRVRSATTESADLRFLEDMLIEAVAWRPDASRPSVEEIRADAKIAIYVERWGRCGDEGVIAERGGRSLGACWYRRFTADGRGYGFIDANIPELTLAVRPAARGQGVATALLTALVDRATRSGHRALSLSVEEDNAAIRLYERIGFCRVGRVDNAWTMRLDLAGS